jgi:hypothetical protein
MNQLLSIIESANTMPKFRKNRNNPRLPKLCGGDIELANFILGGKEQGSTGFEAARALLREFFGFPLRTGFQGYGWSTPIQSGPVDYQNWGYPSWQSAPTNGTVCATYNPQDWGRKFFADNGGCAYIDLDHLEICLPEVISAWDHVAAWYAMLHKTRQALHEANRSFLPDRRIQVLANNSDGLNHSYGSHLNFLISRHAWDNIFLRKMHHLLFLASYQVSSIIFAGQGKVGSENGAPEVPYQLSQRADFFETLLGPQTTFNRPIVNSRDESLCGNGQGRAPGCARLHVIFFDSTYAHVASLLKVGVTQIILSMIEAEFVDPNLVLDDPIYALFCYSHDPTLRARALTVNGRHLTALELQYLFLEEASRFAADGGCEGIVPRADEILSLWEDTLHKFENRKFSELSRRIDWVLKLQIIERAMAQQPKLSWQSPQIKHLDQLYSSIDDTEGLYWIYEKHGFIENVVGKQHIEKFINNPPENTRAYTRSMLLRTADPTEIDTVDWDSISFSIRGGNYWPSRRTIDLAHPLHFTKDITEGCFQDSKSLDEILDFIETLEGDCRTNKNLEDSSTNKHSIHTH